MIKIPIRMRIVIPIHKSKNESNNNNDMNNTFKPRVLLIVIIPVECLCGQTSPWSHSMNINHFFVTISYLGNPGHSLFISILLYKYGG